MNVLPGVGNPPLPTQIWKYRAEKSGLSVSGAIARSPAERLICADPELSALGRDLAPIYREARRHAEGQLSFTSDTGGVK
jgi:uncharacterized protein